MKLSVTWEYMNEFYLQKMVYFDVDARNDDKWNNELKNWSKNSVPLQNMKEIEEIYSLPHSPKPIKSCHFSSEASFAPILNKLK